METFEILCEKNAQQYFMIPDKSYHTSQKYCKAAAPKKYSWNPNP